MRVGYSQPPGWVKYNPDALDNLAEHLRSKQHCKRMAWLTEDMWQTCTTLGGNTVAFNHRTGTTNEPSDSASSARPDWTIWHRTVDARRVASGQLSEQWQGPNDRGSGLLSDDLLSHNNALNLFRKRVGYAGPRVLADWIGTSPSPLRELHLSHNYINRDGA